MKTVSTVFLFFIASTTLFCQNIFPVNGSVGIGTNTPTAPLDVNGLIKSKSIQIYNLNSTPQLTIGVPMGNNRNFNFDINSNFGSEYSDFFIKDNLNNTRLQVFTNTQSSSLTIYDNNQS